ncbi:hypothetical protein ROZALSC1DRAFT_30553, partial [Rozella allomycis CSF55]
TCLKFLLVRKFLNYTLKYKEVLGPAAIYLLNIFFQCLKLASTYLPRHNIFNDRITDLQTIWHQHGFENTADNFIKGIYHLVIGSIDSSRSFFHKVYFTNDIKGLMYSEAEALTSYVKSFVADKTLTFTDIFQSIIKEFTDKEKLKASLEAISLYIKEETLQIQDVVYGLINMAKESQAESDEEKLRNYLRILGEFLDPETFDAIKKSVDENLCLENRESFFAQSCFEQIYITGVEPGVFHETTHFISDMGQDIHNAMSKYAYHLFNESRNRNNGVVTNDALVRLLVNAISFDFFFTNIGINGMKEDWFLPMVIIDKIGKDLSTGGPILFERTLTEGGRKVLCESVDARTFFGRYGALYATYVYFCDDDAFFEFFYNERRVQASDYDYFLTYLYFLKRTLNGQKIDFPGMELFSFFFTKYKSLELPVDEQDFEDDYKSIAPFLMCIEVTTAAYAFIDDDQFVFKWLLTFVQHGNELITLQLLEKDDQAFRNLLLKVVSVPEYTIFLLEALGSSAFFAPVMNIERYKSAGIPFGPHIEAKQRELRKIIIPNEVVKRVLYSDEEINWDILVDVFRLYPETYIENQDVFLTKIIKEMKKGLRLQRACIIYVFQVGKISSGAEFNKTFPPERIEYIFNMMIDNKFNLENMAEFSFLNSYVNDYRAKLIQQKLEYQSTRVLSFSRVYSNFDYGLQAISKGTSNVSKVLKKTLPRPRAKLTAESSTSNNNAPKIGNVYVLKLIHELFFDPAGKYARGMYKRLNACNLCSIKFKDEAVQPYRILFGTEGNDVYIVKAYRQLVNFKKGDEFINVASLFNN